MPSTTFRVTLPDSGVATKTFSTCTHTHAVIVGRSDPEELVAHLEAVAARLETDAAVIEAAMNAGDVTITQRGAALLAELVGTDLRGSARIRGKDGVLRARMRVIESLTDHARIHAATRRTRAANSRGVAARIRQTGETGETWFVYRWSRSEENAMRAVRVARTANPTREVRVVAVDA
jgi:hypothetical protein